MKLNRSSLESRVCTFVGNQPCLVKHNALWTSLFHIVSHNVATDLQHYIAFMNETVGSKTFSHVHCPMHIGPRRATSRVKHFGIVISPKATCYSHRSYSLLDEISVWPCSFSDHWPISMTLLKNDGVIFLVKGSEIMFPPPTHLT